MKECGDKKYECGCVVHVELSGKEPGQTRGRLEISMAQCDTFPSCVGNELVRKLISDLKNLPDVKTTSHGIFRDGN